MTQSMTEIRWHGRGGQGAKTAALLVAQVALAEGKYSQGFPEYGPERQGAPVQGFTRISNEPIRLHCAVEQPDVVVVLDDTLIGNTPIADAVRHDTVFVVNTTSTPGQIRRKLGLNGQPVYCLDATTISIDEMGRPMPNTPMVGALIKATGCISLKAAMQDVEKKFLKKFGSKVVAGNLRAIERAHEEVQSQ